MDTSWFLWNEKESYGLIDFSLIGSLFIRTRWVYINLFLELLMEEVPPKFFNFEGIGETE